MTPQQQLNVSLLVYAGQLAAAGQTQALLSLGFRRSHIQSLKDMTVTDVSAMASSLNGALINARVDPKAIDIMLNINQRIREERETELALVKGGASQRLMKELFGVNVHQYASDREYLGMTGDCGRRATLDGKVLDAIWKAWGGGLAQRYLSTHRATGMPIRDIETVLRSHGGDAHTAGGQPRNPAKQTIPVN